MIADRQLTLSAMPLFAVVPHPELTPGKCRFCGDFEGPMVDTGTDEIHGDRIYICGPSPKRSGCLGQFARAFGWAAPDDMQGMINRIEQLEAELALNWEKTVNVKVPVAAVAGMKES